MNKIAYLGMGTMGGGMAANLLKAGYPVTVWNRSPERCAALVEQGAQQAASIAEAVNGADVVLYCLSDDAAVEALVFGDDGVLEAVTPGQIAIDMTTLHPDTSRRKPLPTRKKACAFLMRRFSAARTKQPRAVCGSLWAATGPCMMRCCRSSNH